MFTSSMTKRIWPEYASRKSSSWSFCWARYLPSISSICSLTSLTKSAALFHSLSYFLSLNSFYNSFWVFGDMGVLLPAIICMKLLSSVVSCWSEAIFICGELISLMPFPNYDWLLEVTFLSVWDFLAALEDSGWSISRKLTILESGLFDGLFPCTEFWL